MRLQLVTFPNCPLCVSPARILDHGPPPAYARGQAAMGGAEPWPRVQPSVLRGLRAAAGLSVSERRGGREPRQLTTLAAAEFAGLDFRLDSRFVGLRVWSAVGAVACSLLSLLVFGESK